MGPHSFVLCFLGRHMNCECRTGAATQGSLMRTSEERTQGCGWRRSEALKRPSGRENGAFLSAQRGRQGHSPLILKAGLHFRLIRRRPPQRDASQTGLASGRPGSLFFCLKTPLQIKLLQNFCLNFCEVWPLFRSVCAGVVLHCGTQSGALQHKNQTLRSV